MVQVIENWAWIDGDVRSIAPAPGLPGWSEVLVQVESCRDDGSFPNLVRDAVGRQLAVTLPTPAVEGAGAGPGDRVVVRVRRATPTQVFGDPASFTGAGSHP